MVTFYALRFTIPLMSIDLLTAFNLKRNRPELIAIVGGGGKTSLLFALARALPGRVVLTTTTRIFAAQVRLAEAVCTVENLSALAEMLDKYGRVLVIGNVEGEKAFGVPPELPGQLLARPDVDYVVVEADGSRMRPIKAPAAHEPVIPPEASLVIPVVGIDALDGPIDEVAHRPELVRAVISEQLAVNSEQLAVSSERLTIEEVARLITHPQGGMKAVPEGARVIPFINKVETETQLHTARHIARHILRTTHYALQIPQVAIGAIKTDQPIREVQQRVTAVILAAGESKRMGQPKQLLPWGDTTVLGQTIRNAKAATLHDILIISGHEAEKIEAIAQAEGIHALRNTQYASGEMLSSLQTAVRHLLTSSRDVPIAPHPAMSPSPIPSSILVLLADQPMVTPKTLDQLLTAYWRGEGDLVAPIYQGQRGNPVLISGRYFAELLALPPGDAPRTLLQRHTAELVLVPVETDAVVQDLDTWEAYERLRPKNQ
jgi:molybdenum cofactor cytidylyltransferase